ncbi:hypothetical protein C8F01DRAFT_1292892 [Mycena amicta]|nr:hypothetical protein C8F01DRAFT_1292892 [Mycena amicta]
MEAVPVWHLKYFYVDFVDPAPKSRISALYQAIASRAVSPSQFSSLTIGEPEEDGDMLDPPLHELDEYAVSGDLLALFRFSNLTHLTLESPAGFIIDDAQIWNLARSWTALELLVHALRAFGMHCNRLKALTMAVDATNLPASDTYPERRIKQTNLQLLDVKESPIDNSGRVASFLSDMFVALWRVETLPGVALGRRIL